MIKKLLVSAMFLSSASLLQAENLDAYRFLLGAPSFQEAVGTCAINSITLENKVNKSTTWEYHFRASGRNAGLGLDGPSSAPCSVFATVKSIGGIAGNSWAISEVRKSFALNSPRHVYGGGCIQGDEENED